MSRSAADATRFTATGPYANARPAYKLPDFMKSQPSSSSSPRHNDPSKPGHGPGPSSGPGRSTAGPPGETPKQKVERLRAQARARHNTGSSLDRMIEVGREVANKAHKVMVYSLITASGVCGALTVYSIISLTLYNRRQRTLWLQNELQKLEAAKQAHAAGTATPEQTEIIKNEIIGEMMKKQKAQEREQRPWNRAKRYLLGGLKEEDAAAQPVQAGLAEQTQTQTQAQTQAQAQSQTPGQLDVLAGNAESAAKETTKSWTSWLKFR